MPGKIAVIGSINVDYTAIVPALPAPGETVLGGELVVANGGKGANQAVAAARAGGAVAMVGRVGEDAEGRAYVATLDAEGIDTGAVQMAPGAKTGVALIFVQRDGGENCIAVCPGANLLLSPRDVQAAAAAISEAAVVLAQLEVPVESVLCAARIARDSGAAFLLNPSPVPATGVPTDLLALVNYLVLNETEIRRLGADLGGGDAQATAHRLVAAGMRAVVLTRGAAGCTIVDERGQVDIAPFAVRPVDAVGAGDAFAGALSTALAEGHFLQEAALFANAAGALAVTAAGAMPSLPRREAVGALLSQARRKPGWL